MHLACAHCCAKWKSLEQTPHTNKYEFLSKRHVILICLKTKNCYCYARARVCVADAIEVYYKIFALFRIHLIYACVLLLEFAHTFYSQRLARDLCRSSSFSCRGIANFFFANFSITFCARMHFHFPNVHFIGIAKRYFCVIFTRRKNIEKLTKSIWCIYRCIFISRLWVAPLK